MKKEGRTLKEIMEGLPADRQKRIREKAEKGIREYKSLQGLRKALGVTQNEIAAYQGIKQVSISGLEKRTDIKLSTLKNYIEAMGCELEVLVKIPKDNTHVRIEL